MVYLQAWKGVHVCKPAPRYPLHIVQIVGAAISCTTSSAHPASHPWTPAYLQAFDQGVAVQAAGHADASLQLEQRAAVGGAVGLERKPALALAAGAEGRGRHGLVWLG